MNNLKIQGILVSIFLVQASLVAGTLVLQQGLNGYSGSMAKEFRNPDPSRQSIDPYFPGEIFTGYRD